MFKVVNFDRTFKNFFEDFETIAFTVDVMEDENSYELLADIPGVDKKDIGVSLENRILTISAKRERPESSKYKFISERRWSGEGKVSYRLSFPVEEKDIVADLNLGVLKVRIPKTKASVKRIEVN